MRALFSPEILRAGAVKGLIVTAMRLPLKHSALTVNLFNFLSFSSSSFFFLLSFFGIGVDGGGTDWLIFVMLLC